MEGTKKTREQLLKENETLKAKIRKQEKAETKQTEKNFSKYLLETANTIILTLDTDANITLFNKFAEKLTGYTKAEVLGRNWFDLFIPKRDGTVIPEVFKDVLKKMTHVSSHENYILCKDGSEKLISWKNTLLKDENKKEFGILSIGTDITESKQAEIELKKHRDHLEELVTERTKELEETNKDLDSALKVFVGRELTISKLEKRIRALEGKE